MLVGSKGGGLEGGEQGDIGMRKEKQMGLFRSCVLELGSKGLYSMGFQGLELELRGSYIASMG